MSDTEKLQTLMNKSQEALERYLEFPTKKNLKEYEAAQEEEDRMHRKMINKYNKG